MVVPVLVSDIFYYFVSSVVTKVGIEVGHTYSFGIKETLKQQIKSQRIYIGDSYKICNYRACSRTSARSYGYILTFCVMNKIPHNEIIFTVPHLCYYPKLVFYTFFIQTSGIFFRKLYMSSLRSFFKPVIRKHPQILIRLHSVFRNVSRQLCLTELKIKIAHIGYFLSIFNSSLIIAEKSGHFIGVFIIKLVCFKPERLSVCYDIIRLNTHKNGLSFGICFLYVVNVIGRYHWDTCTFRQLTYAVTYSRIIAESVILKLKIEVSSAECFIESSCIFLGFLVFARNYTFWNISGKTRRQTNKPLGVFFEKLIVYARL